MYLELPPVSVVLSVTGEQSVGRKISVMRILMQPCWRGDRTWLRESLALQKDRCGEIAQEIRQEEIYADHRSSS